jgi:pyridoxal 5'-phosphate synthase pdxS subunit
MSQIRKASVMTDEELFAFAKEIQAPFHLLKETARLKRLPVVNFAAGGIATPGMLCFALVGFLFSSSVFLIGFWVCFFFFSGCGVDDAAWM